jgi:hypothetical protein
MTVRWALVAGFAVLALLSRVALGDDDPCARRVDDPIVTPVRDVDLDAQRSACLRQDISVRSRSYALIDTPGFHGDLGTELIVAGRLLVRDDYELSAQLFVLDVTFVQNAVNKVTNTAFGPIVVGAARRLPVAGRTRAALAAQLELPYTGDPMDTRRVSGALGGVVTHALAREVALHGRLGGHAMHASSLAGSARWLALRAGADVAWRPRRCVAVHAGAEVSVGWYGGFDHVLARLGVHWHLWRDDWRLRAGLGAPLGGDERTNAILDLALVRGL